MQLGLVVVPLVIFFYIKASQTIAHPDYLDSWFVYTWSFQIMVMLLYLLPTAFCVVLVIAIEWRVVRYFQEKRNLVRT